MARARRKTGLAALLPIALAALGAARADEAPASVRVLGVASSGDATHVLVRNDGPAPATFTLVLFARGEEIGSERVQGLGPGGTRTLAFRLPRGAAPDSLHARVAGASGIAFALGATTLTGVPPGIPRSAWNEARGEARAAALAGGGTSFEIRATGLRPGGLYTLWWVDGTLSPTGGPLAPPPANEARADAQGCLAATVVADFAPGAHERLVLAFHAGGRAAGDSATDIGKTVFAHLVGRFPRPQGLAPPEDLPCPLDDSRLPPR